MKQDIQNIVEGNKAISKFMEYEQHGRQEWEYTYWMIEGKSYREDELKYHSSWDWLMPVVEKIRELGFRFIIGDSNRVTVYNKDYDWKNGSTTDTMIECVWHGCTQFIQLHQQNQKPQ